MEKVEKGTSEVYREGGKEGGCREEIKKGRCRSNRGKEVEQVAKVEDE